MGASIHVPIGFNAPKDVIVHREETFELIRSEQRPARSTWRLDGLHQQWLPTTHHSVAAQCALQKNFSMLPPAPSAVAALRDSNDL